MLDRRFRARRRKSPARPFPVRHRRAFAAIRRIVGDHDRLVGSSQRLRSSVAAIITDALREAEISHHDELAHVISPLVVAVVKREIANSRESMVDALYPLMGRLVAAYAVSGFRDFLYETDRRLHNALSGRSVRLRWKSMVLGVPYRELALREHAGLQVRELLLIEKRSGVPVDRWLAAPESAQAGNEALFGGLLAAITGFASETLAQDHGELRALDLGSARVYVRATPAYLVAAKCVGKPTRDVERRLDGAFYSVLEEYSRDLARPAAAAQSPRRLLPALAERLNFALASADRDRAGQRGKPVLAFAALAAAASFAFAAIGYPIVETARAAQLRERVREAITRTEAVKGYPFGVEIAANGRSVIVTGLAPSREAGAELSKSIADAAGAVPVALELTYLSKAPIVSNLIEGLEPLTQQIAALEATVSRLLPIGGQEGVIADVARVLTAPPAKTPRGTVLEKVLAATPPASIARLAARVRGLSESLPALAGRLGFASSGASSAALSGLSLDETAKLVAWPSLLPGPSILDTGIDWRTAEEGTILPPLALDGLSAEGNLALIPSAVISGLLGDGVQLRLSPLIDIPGIGVIDASALIGQDDSLLETTVDAAGTTVERTGSTAVGAVGATVGQVGSTVGQVGSTVGNVLSQNKLLGGK